MFKTILQRATTLFWLFHLSWFVSYPIKTPPHPISVNSIEYIYSQSHIIQIPTTGVRVSKTWVFRLRSSKKQSKSIGTVIIPWLWTWKEMTPGFSLWNPTDSAQNLLNIENVKPSFSGTRCFVYLENDLYIWKCSCSINVENVLNVWKVFL